MGWQQNSERRSRLPPISEAFGLDFEKEARLLVSQGLEWLELRGRGTALARELVGSHGVEAVVGAVIKIAPMLGFEPWPPEKLRENLLAL